MALRMALTTGWWGPHQSTRLETQTFGFPKTFGKVVGKLNHEASDSKQLCLQFAAASVNLDFFMLSVVSMSVVAFSLPETGAIYEVR